MRRILVGAMTLLLGVGTATAIARSGRHHRTHTTTSTTTTTKTATSTTTSSTTTATTTTTTSTVTGAYDPTVLAGSPVALWDGATDVSGHGHNGTYKGGTPTLTTLPNGESAPDFTGHEYLTVPNSSVFSIPTTGQLTWEAWIRPDVLQFSSASDPDNQGYIDWMGKCQEYSPSCEWQARMYSSVNEEGRCNRLSAYVFNPGAGLGSGADWQPKCNLLRAGQWLYVVGEYQTLTTPSQCNSSYPGTINIWVNGVPWDVAEHYPTGCMSQYKIKPKAGSSSFDIGTMALDSWFPGAIAKVAIYNYLLSTEQIRTHFTAMTGATPSGECKATCTIPVPTP